MGALVLEQVSPKKPIQITFTPSYTDSNTLQVLWGRGDWQHLVKKAMQSDWYANRPCQSSSWTIPLPGIAVNLLTFAAWVITPEHWAGSWGLSPYRFSEHMIEKWATPRTISENTSLRLISTLEKGVDLDVDQKWWSVPQFHEMKGRNLRHAACGKAESWGW